MCVWGGGNTRLGQTRDCKIYSCGFLHKQTAKTEAYNKAVKTFLGGGGVKFCKYFANIFGFTLKFQMDTILCIIVYL